MPTLEEIQEQINKIKEQTAGITTQAESLGATTLESQQAVSKEQADANTLAALTGGDTIPSGPTPILGEPPEERLTTAQTTIDTATATGAAAAARATSESEFFKAQQQIFQEQQKELDALEKKQATFVDKFLKREKIDIEAERKRLQEEFQIPELQKQITPLIADIGALNLRIANIEAQRLASLDASGERTGSSLGFQTGEQKRINREFDRRTMAISAQVTAKTATVNMFRGELDSARGQIDNMIQAIMYDTQVARQDTLDYLNFYENEIGSLEVDQRAIFNDMKTFWEKKEADEQSDLNAKRDLQLFAAQNGVVLNWGPDDYARPLSELNNIVSQRVGVRVSTAPTGFATGTPTSFKEFQLAGGEAGTGMTFSEFLQRGGALKPTAFNVRAGLVGFTEQQATDIFTLSSPPQWFKDSLEESLAGQNVSFSTSKQQELWNQFQATTKENAEKAANSISDIFGSF